MDLLEQAAKSRRYSNEGIIIIPLHGMVAVFNRAGTLCGFVHLHDTIDDIRRVWFPPKSTTAQRATLEELGL